MIGAIHRTPVEPLKVFKAPENITFGYQSERGLLSIWYGSGDEKNCTYVVLPSGEGRNFKIEKIVATAIADGFEAWHLCRLRE